jgi:hypothetical protein
VKVAQLARLLDSLLEGLDGILGAAPVKDLKTFREAMRPFAERNVGDFVAFLGQCEEYQRTGVVPGKKKAAGGKKVADPQQLANAVALARGVLDDINRGLVDGRRIEDTLAQFKALSKPQLDQFLAELNIAGKARSREAAIDKVRQVLKTQAEMYVKTHSGQ